MAEQIAQNARSIMNLVSEYGDRIKQNHEIDSKHHTYARHGNPALRVPANQRR